MRNERLLSVEALCALNSRVRWRVPSEDKLDGRAAIRRTELLWRNEPSDTAAYVGTSPLRVRKILASHSTGSLLAGAVQALSFTR